MALAAALMSAAARAEILQGIVVEIGEGDTLTLQVGRQRHLIRIAGIDAPERLQAWGDQSKTNLSRLASGQAAVADCSHFDPSGHKVCKVTANTRDLGLVQIQQGMAWWNRQDRLSPQERSAYESAELMAKLRRLGLWGDTHPVPPWLFRKGAGWPP